MAFTLQNNFDGGPDGTTITLANSGQVPGNDAFTQVNIVGSSATLTYDASLARPTAEFVMKAQVGATIGYARVMWDAFGSANQLYFRLYGNYPTLPTNANAALIMYFADTTENCVVTVNCPGSSTMSIQDGGTRNPVCTTTNGIVAGEWFRIEGRIQFSTTTGNGELRIFLGNDVDSDTPTETVSFTGANLASTTAQTVVIGYVVANGSHWNPLYISGYMLTDIGWPGPAPFRQKSSPGILTNAIAIHSDTW